MPNWEEIRKEWESSKITFKDLAEKHDVKLGTLKSRRSREKWSRDATDKKDATPNKKVATPKREDAPPKKNTKVKKEPVIENDDLTDKQRLFCIYYVKTFNQTQAAINAGYSPERAHVTGSELVRNRKVSDEIRRLKGEMRQGVFVDAMDVLDKWIKIAFADITDFVEFGAEERDERDEFGETIYDMAGNPQTHLESFVRFKNHYEVDGTIITEVKKGKDGVSVKLADKMRALEMLSKYFDLLSNSDKERFQLEKLKAETAKANAEVKKIEKENETDAPPEITIVDAWTDANE